VEPIWGLSRRTFLKYCATLAAVIGAGRSGIPDICAALEGGAERPAIVWSLFQECLGCSINLLQSRRPDPAQLILRQISLDYHEAVMAPSGAGAEKSFRETVDSGNFYYIVEGAVATKIPGAITIGGRTSTEIVKSTYQKARATICMGSCACYGNIQAAYPNPTGAKGIRQFLSEEGGIANPVVINSPRCPGQAEDTVAILVYLLLHGKVPELDPIGRPLFLFGRTVHDQCQRRGHFDAGEFVETFGDEGSLKRWCFYKVGCKGPVTYAPCPTTKWNGNLSWPVEAGPCIGCSEPGFWDKLTPFYSKAPGVRLPGDVTPDGIGKGLGIATAAGLAAHFGAKLLTGRLRKGGPLVEKDEIPKDR
jgi:hydrogenase small subunit